MDCLGHRQWFSEPSDALLQATIDSEQWDNIVSHARTGASQQFMTLAFSKAVSRDKRDVTIALAKIDPSPEKIDFIIMDALINSRWNTVMEFLKEGVSTECENAAVRGAVRQNLWHSIPDIIRLCKHKDQWYYAVEEAVRNNQTKCVLTILKFHNLPEEQDDVGSQDLATFAMVEAYKHSKWKCVLEIAKLDIHECQREEICQRALKVGHWDCVREMLKQEFPDSYMQDVVEFAFQEGWWNSFPDHLKEDNALEKLKPIFLKKAATCRNWETFSKVTEFSGIADSDLEEVILTVLNDMEDNLTFFCNVITFVPNGRQVFNQIILSRLSSKDLDSFTLNCLKVLDKTDLCGRHYMWQALWNATLDVFQVSGDNKSIRRLAFQQGVRQGAWEHVSQMALHKTTKKNDIRFAVLEAARREEFHWALTLCKDHMMKKNDAVTSSTSSDDRHFECVPILCKLCKDSNTCSKLLLHCIQEANIRELGFVQDSIIEVCKWKCEDCVILSLQERITKHLGISECLVGEDDFLSNFRKFYWCLPILDKVIARDDFEIHCVLYVFKKLNGTLMTSLSELCVNHSLTKAAIFIAIFQKKWSDVEEMMKKVDGSIGQASFVFWLETAIKNNLWEAAISLLKVVSAKDVNVDFGSEQHFRGKRLAFFFNRLRQEGLHEWRMLIALWTFNLSVMREEIDTFSGSLRLTKDSIFYHAAFYDGWDLANKLLDRCSGNNLDYSKTLRYSIRSGEIKTTKKILERFDPLQNASQYSESILKLAVSSDDNREAMVRLCIGAGVSTHYKYLEEIDRCGFSLSCRVSISRSPMMTALYNGQLPLVKLVYASGACTSLELRHLKEHAELRSRLESQNRHDILQYLDTVSTTSRSLQDLSRLYIPHCIGCRPGHRERVLSLPIPELVKNYVLFNDI